MAPPGAGRLGPPMRQDEQAGNLRAPQQPGRVHAARIAQLLQSRRVRRPSRAVSESAPRSVSTRMTGRRVPSAMLAARFSAANDLPSPVRALVITTRRACRPSAGGALPRRCAAPARAPARSPPAAGPASATRPARRSRRARRSVRAPSRWGSRRRVGTRLATGGASTRRPGAFGRSTGARAAPRRAGERRICPRWRHGPPRRRARPDGGAEGTEAFMRRTLP